MGILAWIVLGLIAGVLAHLLMGPGPGGIIGTIVVGIVGALVGGFVMNALGYSGVNGFNVYSILVSVLGAIILLAIYRMVAGTGRV